MSLIDALYFSHRDHRHGRLRRLQLHRPAYVAADCSASRLMFAGVTTTAILDGVHRRPAVVATVGTVGGAAARSAHLRNHVIVVGLGSFGIRVAGDLKAAGHDVAVIERNDDNRYVSSAARARMCR